MKNVIKSNLILLLKKKFIYKIIVLFFVQFIIHLSFLLAEHFSGGKDSLWVSYNTSIPFHLSIFFFVFAYTSVVVIGLDAWKSDMSQMFAKGVTRFQWLTSKFVVIWSVATTYFVFWMFIETILLIIFKNSLFDAGNMPSSFEFFIYYVKGVSYSILFLTPLVLIALILFLFSSKKIVLNIFLVLSLVAPLSFVTILASFSRSNPVGEGYIWGVSSYEINTTDPTNDFLNSISEDIDEEEYLSDMDEFEKIRNDYFDSLLYSDYGRMYFNIDENEKNKSFLTSMWYNTLTIPFGNATAVTNFTTYNGRIPLSDSQVLLEDHNWNTSDKSEFSTNNDKTTKYENLTSIIGSLIIEKTDFDRGVQTIIDNSDNDLVKNYLSNYLIFNNGNLTIGGGNANFYHVVNGHFDSLDRIYELPNFYDANGRRYSFNEDAADDLLNLYTAVYTAPSNYFLVDTDDRIVKTEIQFSYMLFVIVVTSTVCVLVWKRKVF